MDVSSSPYGHKNFGLFIVKKNIYFMLLTTLKLGVFMLLHVVVIHPVVKIKYLGCSAKLSEYDRNNFLCST